jgi:predicted phosphodiesterase
MCFKPSSDMYIIEGESRMASKKRPKLSSKSREIAIVGDLHIGSLYGLWSDFLGDSLEIRANSAQKVLLEYWNDFCEKASGCDTVVLLGDICEGNNRREFGRQLTTAELDAQLQVASKILTPLVSGGKLIISVDGSRYHNSIDLSLDKLVTLRLGGTFFGLVANIRLKNVGTRCFFVHGSSHSLIYLSTSLERESNFLDQSLYRIGDRIDLYARGHLHRFLCLKFPSRVLIQAPCWKLWGGWSKLVNCYGKVQPDLGGVVVRISSSGNIEVVPYLYPTIRLADRVLTT